MTMKQIGTALTLFALLAGCASETGADRAGRVATSMTAVRKMCEDANKQLDKTVAALNALAAVKSGDARPAFDAYVSELTSAQDLSADTRATADEMKAKGRAFFADWEKEIDTIKDADLKAKAKARAEERSKEYSKIEESMGTARGKWQSLNQELTDLKKFLENDLNAKGIESASGRFKQVNLDAVDLKNAINVVAGQVGKVAAELAPSK